MRILVCFKVVRDLESAIREDWHRADSTRFDIAYTKKTLGLYDESALETALCVRDACPACRVDAATVAGQGEPGFVRTLYAAGCDAVLRAEDAADLRFDPARVAARLAEIYRAQGPYDAVFTGMRASPGNSGLVPVALAENLGLPYYADVTDVRWADGLFGVSRETDAGTLTFSVPGPAVFAMGNAVHAYLRMPSLRAKATLGKKPETPVACADADYARVYPPVTGLSCPGRAREARRMEPAAAAEKIAALLREARA